MKVDVNDPLWKDIERFVSERVAQLRAENDDDLDPTETATLRGQIAAFKELLAISETQVKLEVASPTYV